MRTFTLLSQQLQIKKQQAPLLSREFAKQRSTACEASLRFSSLKQR